MRRFFKAWTNPPRANGQTNRTMPRITVYFDIEIDVDRTDFELCQLAGMMLAGGNMMLATRVEVDHEKQQLHDRANAMALEYTGRELPP